MTSGLTDQLDDRLNISSLCVCDLPGGPLSAGGSACRAEGAGGAVLGQQRRQAAALRPASLCEGPPSCSPCALHAACQHVGAADPQPARQSRHRTGAAQLLPGSLSYLFTHVMDTVRSLDVELCSAPLLPDSGGSRCVRRPPQRAPGGAQVRLQPRPQRPASG